MKTFKFMLMAGLLTGWCYADKVLDEDKEANSVHHKAEKLAGSFDISADSVNYLKSHYKIGYGGISKALAMAGKTDYTAEQILVMKTEDKMGWGIIAKKLDLKEGKDWQTPPDESDDSQAKINSLQKKSANLDKKQAKLEKAQAKADRRQNKHAN